MAVVSQRIREKIPDIKIELQMNPFQKMFFILMFKYYLFFMICLQKAS